MGSPAPCIWSDRGQTCRGSVTDSVQYWRTSGLETLRDWPTQSNVDGSMDSASKENLELEQIEHLEDVREDWTRLAEAAGHPFASWDWNAAWWGRFGLGKRLYSFVCRDRTGDAVAILPLYIAGNRPLRVARFLGYADLHSPVCASADRALAARAMREVMGRSGGCPVVVAERLPSAQGWGELLGGRLLARQQNPVLRLGGMSWEDFLASKSANFRGQVRRKERRLIEEQGLTFRLADQASRLTEDLDALFRLHALRWGDKSTGCFEGDQGEFQRDFAVAALQRGWLRLWFAEIAGEQVAAWYGWRFAGAEWYFQAGRDTRWDHYSLGFVMLAHTVREACRDGVSDYHFLAGPDAYKWRFAQEDPGAESRLLSSGPIAGIASLAVEVANSLPASARQRVLRISSPT